MKVFALVSAFIVWQTGCTPTPSPEPKATKLEAAPYQRFVPIPANSPTLVGVPWSPALALDTLTGQLCRTYDMPMGSKWDSLALCWQLYYNRPKTYDE